MALLEIHQKPRIQKIHLRNGKTFDVLRLDEIHSLVSGNKWYKLKYNLLKVQQESAKFPELPCQLLTFGGAYSNHIHASAAAGYLLGIPTIGIIRGEKPDVLSSTLEDAIHWGMHLEFVSREDYAEKDTDDFKSWLYEKFGHVHIVAEGGSNYLGINGCMDILADLDLSKYTAIACAMGTGATVAGLLLSAPKHLQIWGVPVLKSGGFLVDEVRKHLLYFLFDTDAVDTVMERLVIFDEYHFGGYGKFTEALLSTINLAQDAHNLPLDKVYTSKIFCAMETHGHEGVLMLHTGGLQGNRK